MRNKERFDNPGCVKNAAHNVSEITGSLVVPRKITVVIKGLHEEYVLDCEGSKRTAQCPNPPRTTQNELTARNSKRKPPQSCTDAGTSLSGQVTVLHRQIAIG